MLIFQSYFWPLFYGQKFYIITTKFMTGAYTSLFSLTKTLGARFASKFRFSDFRKIIWHK